MLMALVLRMQLQSLQWSVINMNRIVVTSPLTCWEICIPINGSELLFNNAFNLLSFAGGSFTLVTLVSNSIFRNTLLNTEMMKTKTNLSWYNRDLLRAARTALTAHTGSRVSPTRKVMSHSSGMEARNRMSSARPACEDRGGWILLSWQNIS